MNLRIVDDDLADVAAQIVADSAYNQVGLLVDQERGRPLLAGLYNRVPQLQQKVQVPL